MGFIRFLLWTSMCIALGIFIASYRVDGKTPAEHLEKIWKNTPLARTAKLPLEAPTEKHSDEDRNAIDKIIAKRK